MGAPCKAKHTAATIGALKSFMIDAVLMYSKNVSEAHSEYQPRSQAPNNTILRLAQVTVRLCEPDQQKGACLESSQLHTGLQRLQLQTLPSCCSRLCLPEQ